MILHIILLTFTMFYSTILTAGIRPTAQAVDLLLGRVGSTGASAGALTIRTSGAQGVANSNLSAKLQAIAGRQNPLMQQPYGSRVQGKWSIQGDNLESAIAASVDPLKSVPVAVQSKVTPAAVASAVVGALNPLSKVGLAVAAAVAIKDLLDSSNVEHDPLSPSGVSRKAGLQGGEWCQSSPKVCGSNPLSAAQSVYPNKTLRLGPDYAGCGNQAGVMVQEYYWPTNTWFDFVPYCNTTPAVQQPKTPLTVDQAKQAISPKVTTPQQIQDVTKALDSADPSGESLPEGEEPTLKLANPSAPSTSPEANLNPDPDLIFNPDGSVSWKSQPTTTVNPDGSTKTEEKTQTIKQTSPTELTQTETQTTTLKDAAGNPIGSPKVTTNPAPTPTPYTQPTSQSGTEDLCAKNPGVIACEKPVESTPPVPPKDTDLYDPFLKSPIVMPSWLPSDFMPHIPEPSCSYEVHKSFNVFGSGQRNFDLAPCVPLEPLRAVLQWVFGVLSAWLCFRIFFKTTS